MLHHSCSDCMGGEGHKTWGLCFCGAGFSQLQKAWLPPDYWTEGSVSSEVEGGVLLSWLKLTVPHCEVHSDTVVSRQSLEGNQMCDSA